MHTCRGYSETRTSKGLHPCNPCNPTKRQYGNTAQLDCEWYEERAAILEFDAGYPRCEAERLAYLEVTKWQHKLAWQTLQ